MSSKSVEEELQSLRLNNKILAQKVAEWRTLAMEREKEKIGYLEQINNLKFQLNRYRGFGFSQLKTFDGAIQKQCKDALSGLVSVSNSVTGIIEIMQNLTKAKEGIPSYHGCTSDTKDNQEILESCQKSQIDVQSNIVFVEKESDGNSNIENTNLSRVSINVSPKVRRVDPMIKGVSIKRPFITIKRISAVNRMVEGTQNNIQLNSHNPSSNNPSSPESNGNIQPQLQDLHIPLRRINPTDLSNVNIRDSRLLFQITNEDENDLNNSTIEEDDVPSEDEDEGEDMDLTASLTPQPLETVPEEDEPDQSSRGNSSRSERQASFTALSSPVIHMWNPTVLLERSPVPDRSSNEQDPIEGPSWLLDVVNAPDFYPTSRKRRINANAASKIEVPDSTCNFMDSHISSNSVSVGTRRKRNHSLVTAQQLRSSLTDDSDSEDDDRKFQDFLQKENRADHSKENHPAQENHKCDDANESIEAISIDPKFSSNISQRQSKPRKSSKEAGRKSVKILLSRLGDQPGASSTPVKAGSLPNGVLQDLSNGAARRMDCVSFTSPSRSSLQSDSSVCPSPNGSTIPQLHISSEEREPSARTRRPRRAAPGTYKEKPLNLKMRRI